MAAKNYSKELERFIGLVLSDRSLHQQLLMTAEVDSFVALAIRLARERDCLLTDDEVREALDERRRAWLERWI
jgi:hypothetical protein